MSFMIQTIPNLPYRFKFDFRNLMDVMGNALTGPVSIKLSGELLPDFKSRSSLVCAGAILGILRLGISA